MSGIFDDRTAVLFLEERFSSARYDAMAKSALIRGDSARAIEYRDSADRRSLGASLLLSQRRLFSR